MLQIKESKPKAARVAVAEKPVIIFISIPCYENMAVAAGKWESSDQWLCRRWRKISFGREVVKMGVKADQGHRRAKPAVYRDIFFNGAKARSKPRGNKVLTLILISWRETR